MTTKRSGKGKTPVRRARERLGITQFELAVRTGLSLATVGLAERGLVTEATARKLAPVLGVAAAELQP